VSEPGPVGQRSELVPIDKGIGISVWAGVLATVFVLSPTSLLAADAQQSLAVQKALSQIDRTFICPEDLPSNEARTAAMSLFVQQIAAIQPKITIKEIAEYRMSLLKSHQCRETLANIAAPPIAPTQIPVPSSTSHWERAGRVTINGNGINITVDVDSMIDAGSGRLPSVDQTAARRAIKPKRRWKAKGSVASSYYLKGPLWDAPTEAFGIKGSRARRWLYVRWCIPRGLFRKGL
jgi:hypothetical protein